MFEDAKVQYILSTLDNQIEAGKKVLEINELDLIYLKHQSAVIMNRIESYKGYPLLYIDKWSIPTVNPVAEILKGLKENC